jgi:hypothetical protein
MKMNTRPIMLILLVILINRLSPAVAAADDAFYDYKLWQCRIDNGKLNITANVRMTVLNSRGEKYSVVHLHEGKYTKIKRFELKMMDSQNRTIMTLKQKDLQKACGFGASYQVYSDICDYYKEIIYPNPPYSFEYECELEVRSLFFWPYVSFRDEIPIHHMSYELDYPSDFKFRYKPYALNITPETIDHGNRSSCVWTMDSIPALEEFRRAPAGYPIRPGMEFLAESFTFGGCDFDRPDWIGIGSWYADLTRDCYPDDDNHSDMMKPHDSISNSDVVRKLYEDIINRIRYVSISIGISGWKPNSAEFTENNGYGDCKDMSVLMISRLRQIGIEACPVLALTRNADVMDTEFPSFRFNHVFVMALLNGDTVYMDPTCDHCNFGELPYSDEDINVLVVTDTGGFIAHTPASTPESNKSLIQSTLYIDSLRYIHFDCRLTCTGAGARILRERLSHLDDNDTRALAAGLIPGGEKKCSLVSYNIENPDERRLPLTMDFQAVSARPADELNGIIYINPAQYEDMFDCETVELEKRLVPLDLKYPFLKRHGFTITWDERLLIDSVAVPEPDSLSLELGSVAATYNLMRDSIGVDYIKRNCRYILMPDEFSDFQILSQKTKEISSRSIRMYRREN